MPSEEAMVEQIADKSAGDTAVSSGAKDAEPALNGKSARALPAPADASGPSSAPADPPAASSASTDSSAAPAPEQRPAFPAPAEQPTQKGPQGIRFDFNLGARIVLPNRQKGSWRIRLRDLDSGNILFQSENKGAFVNSSKRFFVRFQIEIWSIDEAGVAHSVLEHQFNATGKHVLVQFPVGTLGDILAWFPYSVRFARKHGCRLICAMSGLIIPLLREAYPDVEFVTHEEVKEQKIAQKVYATYSMGLFFEDKENIWQPTDFRHVGLHKTAGYILGVSPDEEPPRISIPDDSRPIPDPYVCIAIQSSCQSKYWNNPSGWHEAVAFLKRQGFRVVCIDQKRVHGHELVWNHIPHGVEDETGDRPLVERARWLKHATCFVGLSSGLAWLAWAMGTPVVMISGFTHPTNEFYTPYRVINWHVCNSCWNDVRHRFEHRNFLWCPRHAGTPRQFECSRMITPQQVIDTIARVPGIMGKSDAVQKASPGP